MVDTASQALLDRLRGVSLEARKLFCVVLREVYHGPLHPKPPGVAVPAEILEACGLDVADFYALLGALQDRSLIEVSGDYPFEEIRLTAEASVAEALAEKCQKADVPLESVFVGLDVNALAL